jgi:hypothetical protein
MDTLAIVTAVLDAAAGTIGLIAALMHLALVVRLRRNENGR